MYRYMKNIVLTFLICLLSAFVAFALPLNPSISEFVVRIFAMLVLIAAMGAIWFGVVVLLADAEKQDADSERFKTF